MRKLNSLSALGILVSSLLLMTLLSVSVASAAQSARVCSNETISDGIFAQVSVANGTSCTLNGSVIVEGDVAADGAVGVTIDGIAIAGSVEIKHSSGAILIQDTQIDGNVKLEENTTDTTVIVMRNTIDGNVKVENNDTETLAIGSFQEGGNTVNGNVTVEDNRAATFITVNGSSVTPTQIGGHLKMAHNNAGSSVTIILIAVEGNIELADNTAEGDETFIYALSVTVGGNVSVENNRADVVSATGNIFIGDSTIGGNLTLANNDAREASSASLSNVEGNITVENNTGGELFLSEDVVGGNIKVENNVMTLEIVVGSFEGDFSSEGNTVAGNVTLKNNRSGEEILVEENTIDGHLKCQDNDPDPVLSGNNVGGKTDCSD